jgi:hypothetical protein
MPLGLHNNAKECLTALLEEAISQISAEKGMFLDRRSGFYELWRAEQVLPQNGVLHDRLINIIGEFPLIEFVRDRLAIELYDLDQYLGLKLSISGYDPKRRFPMRPDVQGCTAQASIK